MFKNIAFVSVFFIILSGHTAPQMSLSANQITYGERLEVSFSDNKPIQEAPDMSVLQKDFIIRGQQQLANTSIINGTKTEEYQLILSLFPRQTGTFQIGPFQWHGQTLPAQKIVVRENGAPSTSTVQVTDLTQQDTQQKTVENRIFKVEALIPNENIYTGETVLYTVRLFENSGLSQAQIQTPPSSQYTLAAIENGDKMAQTTYQNQPVRFYERQFLLTPQETGKITILPAGVLGLVPDKTKQKLPSRSLFPDVFGHDAFFEAAFGPTYKEVYQQSNALHLTVHGKPTDWNGWWLPSSKVTLTEQYKLPAQLGIGTAIERQVKLQALGIESHKLPLLVQPANNHIKSYANPDKRSNMITSEGIVGTEEITFIIVPSVTGEIRIPAIQVVWFNTHTKQQEITELPERIFYIPTVANNSITAQPNNPSQSEQINAPTKEEPNTIVSSDIPNNMIQSIYLWGGGVIIFITGMGLYFLSKIKQRKKTINTKHKKTLLTETQKPSKKRTKKKPLPDLYPF